MSAEEEVQYSNSGRPVRKAATNKAGVYNLDQWVTSAKRSTRPKSQSNPKQIPFGSYELSNTKTLAANYPDSYWPEQVPIANQMLELVDKISEPGPILSYTISHDGNVIATFSHLGLINFYGISEEGKLQYLWRTMDSKEREIQEYYVGKFSPSQSHIIAAGKRKDRSRWDDDENDNYILPGHIKVFNIEQEIVTMTLPAHEEEVLCMKMVELEGEHYLVSGGQDGLLYRWKLDFEKSKVEEQLKFEDLVTCMNFDIKVLPHTGNRIMAVAADDGIVIWDLKSMKKLQIISDLFSSYCDCIKIIPYDVDEELHFTQYCYLLVRGVEEVSDDNECKENVVKLYKLKYPDVEGGLFQPQLIRIFKHENYNANTWPLKLAYSDGSIFLPTVEGQIIRLDIRTGNVIQILSTHAAEVRDMGFHTKSNLFISCSDDGCLCLYASQKDEPILDI